MNDPELNKLITPTTSATKVSTCLPTSIWVKLTTVLRPRFSRAEEGKLDRGVMAEWILNCALSTINNKGLHDCMESFIASKGLKEEFETYFISNSKDLLQ